jgi:hypothetical protein
LTELNLYRCNITNAGLERLKAQTILTELTMSGTNVTAAGLQDIDEALPDCRVIYWPRPASELAVCLHHDLCWNPSTLEQRSDRVNRIGAKAATSGKSIQIYIPFIEETQDENRC